MDLAKVWRASRVSYGELVYRPVLRSGYTAVGSKTSNPVRNALRGAAVNKAIFSLFTMAGAVLPFVLYGVTRAQVTSAFGLSFLVAMTLRVAVSLSILLVFGYIVLYSIQVLPSFVSSGSFTPLAQLPLTARETSAVAVLTLWRTLDYVLVLSLVTQLAAVAYFTGSAAASVVVFLTTASGSLLAVAAALWLTSLFNRKLEGGGMSGIRGLFRPLLFILWGLGVMSAVFLFSLVTYLAPSLNLVLSYPNEPLGFVASLVFPFSAGLLVSSFAGETVGRLLLVCSAVGVLLAVVGCAAASLGASRIIYGVVVPGGRSGAAQARKVDYSIRERSPLGGYMAKDVRVASRNPATGFLFALPIFEVFAVILPLTATPAVRVAEVLAASQACGGFALFIAFLLVTVEDLGVERRSALPLNENVRTLSKVLISTATYVPVPLTLAVVFLSKPFTFEGSLMIPLATLCSVFAACVVEVLVLKALAERGRGAAVRFAAGVGSGECLLALPGVAYAVEYVISRNHLLSLDALVLLSAAELAVAAMTLRLAARTTAYDAGPMIAPSGSESSA